MKLSGIADAYAGARATANVGFTEGGLTGKAEASVGGRALTEGRAEYGHMGYYTRGEGFAGAEAGVSAGASLSGVNAGAKAFAGAKATYAGGGELAGIGAGGTAEGWAGAGAGAEAKVTFGKGEDDKFHIGGEVGVALGLASAESWAESSRSTRPRSPPPRATPPTPSRTRPMRSATPPAPSRTKSPAGSTDVRCTGRKDPHGHDVAPPDRVPPAGGLDPGAPGQGRRSGRGLRCPAPARGRRLHRQITIDGDLLAETETLEGVADVAVQRLRDGTESVTVLQRRGIGSPEAPGLTQRLALTAVVAGLRRDLVQSQVYLAMLDSTDPKRRAVIRMSLTATAAQHDSVLEDFQDFLRTVRPDTGQEPSGGTP
ncbi:hypothetical protein ACIRS3_28575 [Streptomyces virginiae]|uniref:hypothetical protein n=1 Tax=Streptomyces virginiae TaxID=1961 RepID=UPI00380186E9